MKTYTKFFVLALVETEETITLCTEPKEVELEVYVPDDCSNKEQYIENYIKRTRYPHLLEIIDYYEY